MKRSLDLLRWFVLFFLFLVGATWAAEDRRPFKENGNAGGKHLRVGSDHDYPPYEFIGPDGLPSGFNVALIKAVCQVKGLTADIRLGVWGKVREQLEKGEIDMIAGMYYSVEREKIVDFSVPHNRVSPALFVRNRSDIKTFEEAKGKEIIVQKGDIMHDYLVEKGVTDRIILVDDPVKGLTLLIEGQHDAVLLSSRVQGLYFIDTHHMKSLRVVDTPISSRKYCFAVKKGNEALVQALNEGLAELKYTGKYQEIYDAWFGVYEEKNYLKASKRFLAAFGVILFLLGVITAISYGLRAQVKRKTRALVASEKRYRHLVQNASDILMVTDEKGVIVYINPIAETILGYEEAEMAGKSFFDFIYPDYAETTREFYRKQCELKRAVTYYEFPVRQKEGGMIWLGQSAQILEEGNAIKGFQAIARNITERKRMEADLRKNRQFLSDLIENSGALIFVKERKGRYEMVNKRWEEVTRLTRDKTLGKTDLELFPGPIGKAFWENDIRVMEAGMVMETEEVLEDPSGVRYFIAIKFPIRDAAGAITGVCGMATEVTERKRAEDERSRLAERLQRAEKMEALGTLAGGVAHDLNNVLGILVGYSELLLMDIPEESPLRRHIDQILQGGIRASAIVQDLLTLARRGVHSERVISLNALISDFIHTPECEALFSRNAQIRFKRELSPDLLCIRGSTPHLFKTLLNLITNALEAMPQGGWVTVATANRHLEKPVHGYDSVREGDYAVLTISDTGEGIAEEDIRHIFEPFYTKKVMGRSGTGLGLAVVWGTVKDHNGYIDVQSELGIGTTFTLYFPVTRDEVAASQSAAPISVYTGNGETLLVVDDMEEQRDLAARMLEKLNYRVTTLASGEAATAFLQTNRVDLVILDMIMEPGMDGLDTFKKIREIHPDQKAIIVSGYASTERVTQAQALGAGGYVKKPYVLETLGLAVKKELASSS